MIKSGWITALWLLALQGALGFKLQQGYLEPVIARANRPGQVVAIIQNTNASPASNLAVRLELPAGVAGIGASTGRVWQVEAWNVGEVKQFTWDVQSPVAIKATAAVVVAQGGATRWRGSFPVWWQEAVTRTNLDYVPAPAPVDTGRYQVGAIICPFWRDAGYNSIRGYPDRKPALGYYDEGDAEPTDWEIKWAMDHGISFFVPCWYRDPANVGSRPVVPLHHRWLEGGFANGRYGGQAKFAIMSVGKIANSKEDLVGNVFPYWLENYFRRTNYLVLDNQPVLFFFESPLNHAAMAAALTEMRAACQREGYAGLYVLGSYNGFTAAGPHTNNQWMKEAGMDHSFAYHLPTFMNILSGQTPGASEVLAAHQTCWDAQAAGVVPNLVTISSGWDSEPWGSSDSTKKWRLHPTGYATLCQQAKATLDQRTGTGLEARLLLLDNWDEWGEGHFFGVTRQYAWDYLDAVRRVFAPGAPPHADLCPQDVGRGTPYYDGQDRGLRIRASPGSLTVGAGGAGTFKVALSAPPGGEVVVRTTLSLGATNAVVSDGAQLIFTPGNWNQPQKVAITGIAPTTRSLYAFSSADGTTGYAGDWVQIRVFEAPTHPPTWGAWSVDASGAWRVPANWLHGAVASGPAATAYFTNRITASRTVTVDHRPGLVQNLVFGSPGTHDWTLAGGSLELPRGGISTITVRTNSAVISIVLTSGALVEKSGPGTLTLAGANAYSGGSTVLEGVLKAGHTNAFGTQPVTVTSGAAVDVNGHRLNTDMVAEGAGVGGRGALVNTSAGQGGIRNLTLAGDTTLRAVASGLNVFGPVTGDGFTLTILGNPGPGYVGVGNGASDLGDINILSGAFYANGYLPDVAGCLGRASNTVTVAAGGTLGLMVNRRVVHDKKIVLNGGRIWQGLTGSPTLAGAITLNQDSQFDVADALAISGPIGGGGGLIKTSGGTLLLAGTNSYRGNTVISAGTLQFGAGASVSRTPLIVVSNQAVLDVSALAGGWVLGTNQTLAGNGTVNGNVVVRGALSPGSSIGRLAIEGAAVLQGTVWMELSRSGETRTNDVLVAGGQLACGGSLVVANLGPDGLAAGERFQLFQAADYTGAFASVALPPLGAGFRWVNRLATEGTLAVVAEASQVFPEPCSGNKMHRP